MKFFIASLFAIALPRELVHCSTLDGRSWLPALRGGTERLKNEDGLKHESRHLDSIDIEECQRLAECSLLLNKYDYERLFDEANKPLDLDSNLERVQSQADLILYPEIPEGTEGLKHISVGSDGTVWGITPSDLTVRRKSINWELMLPDVVLESISVNNANDVWGVDTDGVIHSWNGNEWATDSSLDSVLQVLRTSSDTWASDGNGNIFKLNGTSWSEAFQDASTSIESIAFGDEPSANGNFFSASPNAGPTAIADCLTVTVDGTGDLLGIFYMEKDSLQFIRSDGNMLIYYNPSDGVWNFCSATNGVQVGECEGAIGRLYYVAGSTEMPSEGAVGGWNNPNMTLTYGCALEGCVTPNDDFIFVQDYYAVYETSKWGLDGSGNVFQMQEGDWEAVEGVVLSNIDVSWDGFVVGVDAAGSLYRRVPPKPSCFMKDSGIDQIFHVEIANNDTAWATTLNNEVYKLEGGAWVKVDGQPLKQVSVGSDGSVWGVGPDDTIYQKEEGEDTFILMDPGSSLKQIAVGSKDHIWGINNLNGIYRRDKQGGKIWNQISGGLSQISVGSDGEVWGVNAGGRLYRRDENGNQWVESGVGFKFVEVKDKSDVLAVDISGKVFRYSRNSFEPLSTGLLQSVRLDKISVDADDVWALKDNHLFHGNQRATPGDWEQIEAPAMTEASVGSSARGSIVMFGVNADEADELLKHKNIYEYLDTSAYLDDWNFNSWRPLEGYYPNGKPSVEDQCSELEKEFKNITFFDEISKAQSDYVSSVCNLANYNIDRRLLDIAWRKFIGEDGIQKLYSFAQLDKKLPFVDADVLDLAIDILGLNLVLQNYYNELGDNFHEGGGFEGLIKSMNEVFLDLTGLVPGSPCGSGSTTGGQGFTLDPALTEQVDEFSVSKIALDFCYEKADHERIFNAIELLNFADDLASIDLESRGVVHYGIYSRFGVQLSIEEGKEGFAMTKPLEIDIDLGLKDGDVVVGVGMLDLQSSAEAVASASFKICIEDKLEEKEAALAQGDETGVQQRRLRLSCTQQDANLNLLNRETQQNDTLLYWGSTFANFSISGGLELLSDIKNLEIGDVAKFEISDSNIFDGNAPKVNFTNFDAFDFQFFSTQSAITLLNTIDSILVHAQENQVFKDVKVPLTDTKLSDVITTGSILTRKLHQYFVRPEPFEKRSVKSLLLRGEFPTSSFPINSTSYANLILQRNELTVNPKNDTSLVNLATEDLVNNTFCRLTIPPVDDTDTIVTELTKGLSNCSLHVCSLAESREDIVDPDSQCWKTSRGDFKGCNCDLVIDITENEVFEEIILLIATTAYKDANQSIPNDVQAMSLSIDEAYAENQGETFFGIELKDPEHPLMVSRFTNWEQFRDTTLDAIADFFSGKNVDFDLYYEERDGSKPPEIILEIKYKDTPASAGTFSDAISWNEFNNAQISNSSFGTRAEVALEADFAVVLSPDNVTNLRLTMDTPCEDFLCDMDVNSTYELFHYKLYYEQIGSSGSIIVADTLNLTTHLSRQFDPADTIKYIPALTRILKEVEKSEPNSITLIFHESISRVEFKTTEMECKFDNGTITQEYTGCTDDSQTFERFLPNAYGIEEEAARKPGYQVKIGELDFKSNFDISGDLALEAELGGFIEVGANISAASDGEVGLKINPKESGRLSPSDWFAALISVGTDDQTDGFFEAFGNFRGNLDGDVRAMEPFASSFATFQGTMKELSLTFFGEVDTNVPTFEFDIDLPDFGELKKLSYGDILDALSRVIDVLVGDTGSGSNEEKLRSCSGGILGKTVNGRPVFQEKIPGVEISVCDLANNLAGFVDGVELLVEEAENGNGATINTLDRKLTSMFMDVVGGTPTVNLIPSDDAETSNLEIAINFKYPFNLTQTATLDVLEETKPTNYEARTSDSETPKTEEVLSLFRRGLIPDKDAPAEVSTSGDFDVFLCFGIEYNKQEETKYIFLKGTTGLNATFKAEANLDFFGEIGPLKASVSTIVRTGDDLTGLPAPTAPTPGVAEPNSGPTSEPTAGPISFAVEHHRKNERLKVAGGGLSVTDQIIEIVRGFEFQAEGNILFSAHGIVGREFFDVPPALGVTVAIDLDMFFNNPREAFTVTDGYVLGPEVFKMPTFLDILLQDPEVIIGALDQFLKRVEYATVGKRGIITFFPAPFIKKGLGRALGAGQTNNIIFRLRQKLIPTLRKKLNQLKEDKNAEITTIGDFIAQEIQEALKDNNLIYGDKTSSASCFFYNETSMQTGDLPCVPDENSPNATSIMWSVPVGQIMNFKQELDFDFESKDFPFELKLEGDIAPTLHVEWSYTLNFGFDAEQGFFISTYAERDTSEMSVKAWLSLEDETLSSKLHFLNASMTDLDLNVAAAVWVDILKPDAINRQDRMYNRVTLQDILRLNQPADLFELASVAGSTFSTNVSASVDIGDDFETIEKIIPKFNGRVAAQIRKEAGNKDITKKRRALRDNLHGRELSMGPSHGIFRWLASESSPAEGILVFGFGEDWSECPVAGSDIFCAKMSNIYLDIRSVRDGISDLLEPLVNDKKTGYLDRALQPLNLLNRPIRDTILRANEGKSVLGMAKIYCRRCPTKQVEDLLSIYETLREFQKNPSELNVEYAGVEVSTGVLAQDKYLLADECTFDGRFVCKSLIFEEGDGFQGRALQSANSCSGNCQNCNSLRDELVCRINDIPGLTMPILDNPTWFLGVLNGEDAKLLDLRPPEVSWSFDPDPIYYTIWPAPQVQMGLDIHFSVKFKYGVFLDTSGIREAIKEREPLKAVNSLALIDTFDGVQTPVLTMEGKIELIAARVNAWFASVTITGDWTVSSWVDLYDPHPETSNGIVRPYELISMSLDPRKWVYYKVSSQVGIRLRILLKVWWKTIWDYDQRSYMQVGQNYNLSPPGVTSIVECGPESQMQLNPPLLLGGVLERLECTSLRGYLGNEDVECLLRLPDGEQREDSGDPIQSCKSVSRLHAKGLAQPNQHVVLRDIQSLADLEEFGPLGKLDLMYDNMRDSIISGNMVMIGGKTASVGAFEAKFESVKDGLMKYPAPEQDLLTTVVGDGCNGSWQFIGYTTELNIKVAEIESYCDVMATGDDSYSRLVVDLTSTEPCTAGSIVEVSSTSETTTTVEIKQFNGEARQGNIFVVDDKYEDIEIIMTECDDELQIRSTAEKYGSIAAEMMGGDDTITVGDPKYGLSYVYMSIKADGGDGSDKLILSESGTSTEYSPDGVLLEGIVEGVLGESEPFTGEEEQKIKVAQDVFYESFENLEIKLPELGSIKNRFRVDSFPEGMEVLISGRPTDEVTVVGKTDEQEGLTIEGPKKKAVPRLD